MALLKIKSNNPNLSYVLRANPSVSIIGKKFKKGIMIGFYLKGKTDEYIITFKDSLNETSFKVHEDAQYEYLSNNQYNDARFISHAFSEMCKDVATKELEEDIVCDNEIYINAIGTTERTFSLFKRHFSDVKIEYTKVSHNCFQAKFSAHSTLKSLIDFVSLFSLLASLEGNDNFIYVEDSLSEKYAKIMNNINAPYFLRYVFKVNMLRSPSRFEAIKPLLDTENLNFAYGDTHTMRMDEISNLFITKDKEKNSEIRSYIGNANLVDVGAGYDFRYLKMLQKHVGVAGFKYIAIERDEDAFERIKARINTQKWSHVEVYNSLESYLEVYKGEPVNVICTEVLEHNEFDEAVKLCAKILNELNYKTSVFTVPNKEFNKFYFEDENEIRHDDHKWEPDFEMLKIFISSVFDKIKKGVLYYELKDIGDIYTNEGKQISPTFMITFEQTQKNEENL